MAVYTNLDEDQIKDFLKLYNIGELVSFSGITEGIENSNFHLKTSNGNYVLTIFEKRVKNKDVPFFVKLMDMMHAKGFKCPKPIPNIYKRSIFKIKNKPAIIVSYLEGKSKKILNIFLFLNFANTSNSLISEGIIHIGFSMITLMLFSRKDFAWE